MGGGGGAHSLGAEAHAQAGQVPVGEGEDDHEDDVPGVVGKDDGEATARLNVAQHEEGDEDEPGHHQDGEPPAVLAWLPGKKGHRLMSAHVMRPRGAMTSSED